MCYSSMQNWYLGHIAGCCTYKGNSVMSCALNAADQEGIHQKAISRLISLLSRKLVNAMECTCPPFADIHDPLPAPSEPHCHFYLLATR